MAVYGVGAWYGVKGDVSEQFVSSQVVCVGWEYVDASSLHEIMYNLKIGDIIYIKAYPKNVGLIIKAVGIVTDNEVLEIKDLGHACVKVKWTWTGKEVIGVLDDKYNVRQNTIYEEYNPIVIRKVIDLLTQNHV